MQPEISLTEGPVNTKFAPLAALGWHYLHDGTFQTFEKVTCESRKTRLFAIYQADPGALQHIGWL